MEQSGQQIIQKPPLPIKTKIAAWWMITLGALLMILSLLLAIIFYYFISPYAPQSAWVGFIFFMVFIIPILPILWILTLAFCLLGFFILKKKKIAWWIAMISLLIGIIPLGIIWTNSLLNRTHEAFIFISFILILLSLPLTLLLFDRKNFFKIAS